MLVLSRRKGQSIKIGECLTVVVVSSSRGRVLLGIEAPRHVPVLRNEVLEKQTAKEILKTA